jgi:hypothetical protein
MVRWRNMLLGVTLFAVVMAGGPVVQAQGGNLLANPGFEGFYRSYDYGNAGPGLVLEFRVADGWQPWHRTQAAGDPEWRYRRPEYRPASYSYNGSAAQQFFTSFGTHEAGIYQQVGGVVAGRTYRFSIALYIWSSMGGDFYRSEQPGGARARVGIDPAGGTNPYADSVVWSPFATFYDTWRVLAVDAVAQGRAATVFVWSTQEHPVVHNDVALDDAFFGQASGAPLVAGSAVAVVETAVAPAAAAAEEATVVEQAPPVASPTGVTISVDANVRVRERLYGQVIAVIPAGEAVAVLGRSADRNWAFVEYGGVQGWIGSWLGQYSSQFEGLPVVNMP